MLASNPNSVDNSMADPSDASVWAEVGKAIAYILSGAGGIWGAIWGTKKMRGDRNTILAPAASKSDLDKLETEVTRIHRQVEHNTAFIHAYAESAKAFEATARRIHERIDKIGEAVARMEGRMEK